MNRRTWFCFGGLSHSGSLIRCMISDSEGFSKYKKRKIVTDIDDMHINIMMDFSLMRRNTAPSEWTQRERETAPCIKSLKRKSRLGITETRCF